MAKRSTENTLESFTPPHDIVAEKSLLGSVLLSSDAFYEVAGTVRDDHFYSGANRQVWLAVRAMYEDGRTGVDVVLLRNQLEKSGQFDFVGGNAYLLDLMNTVPHAAHAAYYAKIVADCFVRRKVIEAGEEMIRNARSPMDVEDLASKSDQAVADVTESLIAGETPMAGDLIDAAFQSIMDGIDKTGASTSFANLDDIIGGLIAGHMDVLAARPCMGKTAIAGALALHVSKTAPVLFFSLEMTALELLERFLCSLATVDSRKLRRGECDEIDQGYLSAAAEDLRKRKLFVDDKSGRTVSQIDAISRKLKRKQKALGLVVVDYIQIVQADDPSLPREQQIAATTRRLKMLAKDLNVPVLALCQINREVEKREDKRPRLSDLRESGAIEQDADIVMAIHRPDAYDADDRPKEVDVIVLKNRHGAMGTAELVWRPDVLRFGDKASVTADIDNDF
jgi:replicative DNA helicase